MVGEPECHVAGLEALSVDDIALKNHAIDGRANDEGVWHVALALDLIDKVRRHTEVLQATCRTDNASRGLRPRGDATSSRTPPEFCSTSRRAA